MAREHRLLRHRSNLGRLADQTAREYLTLPPEKRNALDVTTHAIGAVGNIASNALETLFKDGARWIEGRTDPVPSLPEGHFARTREDIGELFGVFKYPVSAVASVVKMPGDVAMDLYDTAIGNYHTAA
ncbi:MAG: hypothetical protein WCS85_04670 [Candidatus Peribacteraceae bacterium]